jgi:hypothetical protein
MVDKKSKKSSDAKNRFKKNTSSSKPKSFNSNNPDRKVPAGG